MSEILFQIIDYYYYYFTLSLHAAALEDAALLTDLPVLKPNWVKPLKAASLSQEASLLHNALMSSLISRSNVGA